MTSLHTKKRKKIETMTSLHYLVELFFFLLLETTQAWLLFPCLICLLIINPKESQGSFDFEFIIFNTEYKKELRSHIASPYTILAPAHHSFLYCEFNALLQPLNYYLLLISFQFSLLAGNCYLLPSNLCLLSATDATKMTFPLFFIGGGDC